MTASAGCALLKSVFSSISMLESFDFFIFCSSKKPNATLMGGSYKSPKSHKLCLVNMIENAADNIFSEIQFLFFQVCTGENMVRSICVS